jgi:membrane associated rhomboid family serine protease
MPVLQDITSAMNNPTYENLRVFFHLEPNQTLSPEVAREALMRFRTDFLNGQVTVGASGAVFGILLAFGMLFPNTRLMLLIPPIPIKAKYFVIIYGVAELFLGVANFSFDNVAHFAHLGGMLFGFVMIKYWQKKGIY